MRSLSFRLFTALSALVLLSFAAEVHAQATAVSGISYIDCRSRPRFVVGDWVKYHFTGKSDAGEKLDYEMTILISGEEIFWGEPCFWVETLVSLGGQPATTTDAKLVSYSMFGDTLWEQRMTVYQRKYATLTETGQIRQELIHRSLSRKPSGKMAPVFRVIVDTLGREQVSVPRGSFRATKVRLKSGVGATEDIGDSTRRIENWDVRTRFYSNQVPVTSTVKEITEQWMTRKTWRVGRSADAIQSTIDSGTGTLELVAFGNGGVKAELTPTYARKPLAKRPVIVPRMPAYKGGTAAEMSAPATVPTPTER